MIINNYNSIILIILILSIDFVNTFSHFQDFFTKKSAQFYCGKIPNTKLITLIYNLFDFIPHYPCL